MWDGEDQANILIHIEPDLDFPDIPSGKIAVIPKGSWGRKDYEEEFDYGRDFTHAEAFFGSADSI